MDQAEAASYVDAGLFASGFVASCVGATVSNK
jgi:hypothetical protein